MSLPGDYLGVCRPGTLCECGQPAVGIWQGETDSFGFEELYFCQACSNEFVKVVCAPRSGECDWCHKEGIIKETRDPDEGMHGPVYDVCKVCRNDMHKRLMEELEYYEKLEREDREREERWEQQLKEDEEQQAKDDAEDKRWMEETG